MNKKLIVLIFSIIFLFSILTVYARVSDNERQCLRDSSTEYRNEIRLCSDNYKENRSFCVQEKRDCRTEAREIKNLCYDNCSNFTDRTLKNQCRRACSKEYINSSRTCSNDYRTCRSDSQEEKNDCKSLAREDYSEKRFFCKNDEGGYNFNIEEAKCTESGGFYQQLCKGPYFGIVCSQKSYCQCGGINNYSCPESSECILDHDIRVRGRGHSLPGWKTLLGQELGDVGLCANVITNETNNTTANNTIVA